MADEIQRYAIYGGWMMDRDHGGYVRYDDHVEALSSLRAENERLREQVEAGEKLAEVVARRYRGRAAAIPLGDQAEMAGAIRGALTAFREAGSCDDKSSDEGADSGNGPSVDYAQNPPDRQTGEGSIADGPSPEAMDRMKALMQVPSPTPDFEGDNQ